MIETLNLEPCSVEVKEPKDALKVQGDLEYVYAISLENPYKHTRFDIYRTSWPYIRKNFVFHLFGCYVTFAPKGIAETAQKMELIQTIGDITLNAIAEYEKASPF